MNLVTSFQNFATRVGQEFKSVRTLLNNNAPDLTALSTTAKGSIVAAINELQIADVALHEALTASLAQKLDSTEATRLIAAQNDLTMMEIATALNDRLGDPNVDLVATFNAALA